MNITQPREVFKPFEYPKAEQFAMQQHQAHWLHTEVQMGGDVQDWKVNLTDDERRLVGNVLKGFTQVEVYVGSYWGQMIPKWFPKPEIQLMGATFAAFEAIHALAYAHLNTTLGLEDFDAFLYEPTAKAKLDALIDDERDAARSLAVYSAFAEGVSLFSAFSILMSFSQRNLLKGVGQIVSWSVRDESLHSRAGCWLFRELMKSHPELNTKKLEDDVYEAANLTVALEHGFIDMCFDETPIANISPAHVRALVNQRANAKLSELGYRPIFDVFADDLEAIAWFDRAAAGVEHSDFFAMRPTSYSKGHVDWEGAFA